MDIFPEVKVPSELAGAIAIPEGFDNPQVNMEGVLEAIGKMADKFLTLHIGNEGSIGLMIIPNGGLMPAILLLQELSNISLDYSKIPVFVTNRGDKSQMQEKVSIWFAPEDMYDTGETYRELLKRLPDGVSLHLSVLTKKQSTQVPGAVVKSSPNILTLPDEWIYSWAGLNSNIDNPVDPELRVLERNCTIPLVKIGDGVNQDNLGAYKNFLREHQHFAVNSKEFELMLQIESTSDLVEKRNLFMQYLGFIQEA